LAAAQSILAQLLPWTSLDALSVSHVWAPQPGEYTLVRPVRGQPHRYELLMLKGECQLQMRDRLGASTAFKSAAKSAANLDELAAARANAVIVERSTSGRYLPRPGARADEAIDILLIDPRKHAMMAVQAELWSQCKPQVDAALRANQIGASARCACRRMIS
jgi:hypothetical protein